MPMWIPHDVGVIRTRTLRFFAHSTRCRSCRLYTPFP